MLKNKLFITLIIFVMFSCSSVKYKAKSNTYNLENLKNLPLKEKIAQMIMIRSDGKFHNNQSWSFDYINSLIQNYKIGGLITYSGSVHGTFHNLKSFQNISKIPLFIAADYERGLGTFMNGTLFPPNMAIAATGSNSYPYEQGRVIAKEAKSIGVNMIFAPVMDINNNYENPIINIRSYGDTPETVVNYGIPFINGVQDYGLIACAKHYPGHGNTSVDSHTSLPIINIDENQLFNYELLPFRKACENNVKSIMVGHIKIPNLDKINPSTFSKSITHDILREKWNYNGLIITDALEMGALTSTTWHGEAAIKAIEGGADIILLPIDGIKAINKIYEAVKNGRISEDRIDASFNRIINEKQRTGLFNKDSENNWEEVKNKIGILEHTKLASEIAEKSITLVKNDKNLLPFKSHKYKKVSHILLSSDYDLKDRMKSYAYNIKYTHGNVNEVYVDDSASDLAIKDIINKVKNSDVIIVSMLIRISMNKGLATIDKTHNKLLDELNKLNIPTIGVSFGSPYLPNYNTLDTYMCAYGYGTVSLDAAFDAIFGRKPINGKLPITLNKKYKIGHGIEVKKNDKIFEFDKNINLSVPLDIIYTAIADSVFPGAQIFVSKGDTVLLDRGFGYYTYNKTSKLVSNESIYDVASLTKVLATTPVVMKLVQSKRLSLSYPLYDFFPEFKDSLKKSVTVRHLLTHTAGFPSYVEYYKDTRFNSREKIINDIISNNLTYKPDSKTIYSDLGMIVLLEIIEQVSSSRLDKLANRYYFKPLGMKNTFFNPDSSIKSMIVPTENDNYFRNRVIQGEVHDENAYLLGGVSTHAGLFSTASDIGIFSKMLLNEGIILGKRYIKSSILKKFIKRINIPQNSDRTIGWDTPSQNGNSSAGDYFSKNTYGHLGFTGTSLWIDPNQDIIVVLLTNRVYPERGNNNKIKKVRRDFHNELMKIIGG